jgi:glycosyltransferase involved in cell wall biosynthesis
MPSDRIRVCQIVSTFSPLVGGVQLATERLCRALRDRNVDAVVLTRCYPGLKRAERIAGIPVFRLGARSEGKLGALSFALHALWVLATRLRRYRIVHVQNIDTPLLIGFLARTLLRRRLVATIHGEAKLVFKSRTRLGRARLSLMRRLVDRFGALTEPMQRELEARGVAQERIRLIPNGIDTTRFHPPCDEERAHARARLGLPSDAVVCLSLGRLVPGKRIDLLLRAWALLPRGTPRVLLIVGDGPERRSLEDLAARLQLQDVRFEGATTDPIPYLHAADLFVSASERECLSLALLEAMAAGVAPIVTDLPGNEVLVRHAVTGLLVPSGDPRALADGIAECLRDPALARRLGQNASAVVREGFSLDRVAQLHRDLYREMLPDLNTPYVPSPAPRLRVLRLVFWVGPESAPFHQFSLAAPEHQQITLCTFLPPAEPGMPTSIRVFAGDGSVRGFLLALDNALRAGTYDVIHAHSPHVGLLLLLALLRRPAPGTPRVYTVHNSYQSFRLRNRLMLLPVFAAFHRIVCCGEASYRSFPAPFRRLAGQRLTVIPNGLNIRRVDRVTSAQPRSYDGRPFTAVMVARLVPIKNPFTVVDAFRHAADDPARLLLVGDGQLRDDLRAHIEALQLRDRVELTGRVPRDAVYHHLWNADLFLSASRGEGLPIAVLEAMACRCPVVLSDIPPHREIAAGTDFIPLVDPDDVEGFAREIRRFQAMSPAQRAEIGAACRRLVEQRFSLEAMHRQYGALFARLVEAARQKERRGAAARRPATAPSATAEPSR